MFISKKRTAIKAIQKQKEKLDHLETFDGDNMWTIQTRELLKLYMGENSEFYAIGVKKLNFNHYYSGYPPQDVEEFVRGNQAVGRNYLDACIEFIETHGVHKESKPNWIYTIKSEYVNLAIVVLIPSIFIAGMWFNSFQSNTANINALQKRIETLNDSIMSLSNPANNNAETPNNPKN
ncbi:MAG: hypothetical protein Q8K92_04130 [Leadbetterella sp.]|nr:hypothetical protein [Leadbetterella sp.]